MRPAYYLKVHDEHGDQSEFGTYATLAEAKERAYTLVPMRGCAEIIWGDQFGGVTAGHVEGSWIDSEGEVYPPKFVR
jgi:hypothetical protein